MKEEWRERIRRKTGWSDAIINAIRSEAEAQIYIDAGLIEAHVGGRPALIQPRIDLDMTTPEWFIRETGWENWRGWTNSDLMGEGYAPFSSEDMGGMDPMELHHIGQRQDSPYAELTWFQHHSDGNFAVLHTFDDSEIERTQFADERKQYWMARYNSIFK